MICRKAAKHKTSIISEDEIYKTKQNIEHEEKIKRELEEKRDKKFRRFPFDFYG